MRTIKEVRLKNALTFILGVGLLIFKPCLSNAQAPTADQYFSTGDRLYAAKDYYQAARYYNGAIKLNPRDATAYQKIGDCYNALGDFKTALAYYRKALQLNPNSQELSKSVQDLSSRPSGGEAPISGIVTKSTEKPPYAVPRDAKVIDTYFLGEQNHIWVLVLAKLQVSDLTQTQVQEKTYDAWLVWDSGAGGETRYKPLVNTIFVSTEFLEHLQFTPQNKMTGYTREFYGKKNRKIALVSKEPLISDYGSIEIQMTVGDMTWNDVNLVSHDGFEGMFQEVNALVSKLNAQDNFIKSRKVAGLFEAPMMDQYLFSIDYKYQKIYLRPLDSDRRTFFDAKPLKRVSFQNDEQGLTFIKVAINHKWKGYAMLDTGSQDSIIDSSLGGEGGVPMTSFMMDDQELMTPGSEFSLGTSDKIKKLTGERDLVLLLGSDFFKFENSFITFDPQNGDIYFEKND